MSLFQDLERFASRTALVDERGERVPYATLLEAADALGARVPARSLAFVVCRNGFEAVAGYVGLIRAGAALGLVQHTLHDALLSPLLERYRPAYVFLPRARRALVAGKEAATLGDYVLVETGRSVATHPDLALLLTTSGSTGSPKMVRLSHANLASNATAIAESLEIGPDDRPITTMPMSYSYGLSILNSHLTRGAAVVLNEAAFMERGFWDTLRRHEATTFGGVPFAYEMLKKLRFAAMELPSLRYCTQAGGRLRPELAVEFAEACERKRIRFYVMYGQTEATARISCLPWEQARAKAGSIGRPIPGGELWLEDAAGRRIETPDTPGELVYRGTNVSLGYANGWEDLIAGDDNRGVLRTGDVATRDADGYFYVVGRQRRFLKLFGLRVNLDEVEQLLRGAGYDCACVGSDDRLRVYVTTGADPARLAEFLSERTGIHRTALSVVAVDRLPRGDSGKVLYSELK